VELEADEKRDKGLTALINSMAACGNHIWKKKTLD